MDGSEFFETEFMYAIMTWNLPIWYILCVALIELMCIFTFGPSFLPCCLSIWLFCFSLPYSAPKLFYCLVSMPSYILLLLVGKILFSLFWNVLFYLYYFTLSRYILVFLLSPVPSGSFPCVILTLLLELLFPFLSQHVPAFSFCFIIFACL